MRPAISALHGALAAIHGVTPAWFLTFGDAPASSNAWQKFQNYDPSAAHMQIPDNCVWEFYFR